MIVAASVPSGNLLDDRERVRAFWRSELGRTDEPDRIDFLTGGVSSIVVRVTTDEGAFVIKQALPQLRVEAAWYSRPERSAIEARCALALAKLVPGSVPEVVAVVADRNAFVMRGAPAGTETWKDQLLGGEVSLPSRRGGRTDARPDPRSERARDWTLRLPSPTGPSSMSSGSIPTCATWRRGHRTSRRPSTRSPPSS